MSQVNFSQRNPALYLVKEALDLMSMIEVPEQT